MGRVHKPDYIFLTSIAVLLAFGLLTLFSASSAEGLVKFQDGYFFIKRQLLLGVLPGLVLFYFTTRIDYHWWRKFAKPLFYFSLLLLVLLLVPGIGDKIGTAKSWFVIGGFSFQPAELLKLTLIFYLGSWLADSVEEDFYHWHDIFLRFVIVIAIFSFLILTQPDFGTLMILLLIAFAVYYSAGGRFTHLACLVGVGLLGVAGLVWSGKYGRLLERFTVFLNPGFDSQGLGYQISQALLAIGSGGIWGLGWGHSRQKIALSAPDRFGKIVVMGVMVWMIGQSFINIASMTGLLPLTGVPLPLVSHGGTALAIMLAAIGVVVNVSKNTV
ncbi:MAG: Cell division-specific peptidoglycan biosynthesis regulator FtsW [Candidatus Magasanikbacteria bacterium GW2011_GWA2_41_55]|uniref:Probable peptidoglycan glycosyltransferase FtsW n=1 Tax=Candidatus Magasanikbacteria bacterium GW2011_GWA2_41_55 TaxID=1619038 RepID=A0A0G0YS88_9BACT|nr:MAG: Cell division-specific peptidoglycan biosynthesis regulator FtsW [Candidatus Magasanikbacteria bacterium GW2011_GWA2_41_55]